MTFVAACMLDLYVSMGNWSIASQHSTLCIEKYIPKSTAQLDDTKYCFTGGDESFTAD